MIDLNKFQEKLEEKLRNSRRLDENAFILVTQLPAPYSSIYGHVIDFLGCKKEIESQGKLNIQVSETERLRIIRLILFRLYVDTCIPRWSSQVLATGIRKIMSIPGAEINDVYSETYKVLGEFNCLLTKELKNFLLDLTKTLIANYKKQIHKIDIDKIIENDRFSDTSAKAYCRYLLVTADKATPELIIGILEMITDTDIWSEVVNGLQEFLQNPSVKPAVIEWLHSKELKHDQARKKIETMCSV